MRHIVDIAKDLRARYDGDKHQPKIQKDGGKDNERRAEILTITGPANIAIARASTWARMYIIKTSSI